MNAGPGVVLARLIQAGAQVEPLAPVSPVALRLPQLAEGARLRALVGERLADGAFRVQAGNQQFRMNLPTGTSTGDTVDLRVVATEPRLRFDVDSPQAEVRSRLSDAARTIGRLLDEAPSQVLRQSRPVIDAPTTESAGLAAPLARALARSGLFYESHQALWVGGEYPLEQLREEPQAGARAPHPQTEGRQEALAERTAALSARAQAEGGEPADEAGRASATTARDAAPAPVARDLLPLVRQQIETLETRHVLWHGEVWPGQTMDWEVVDERDARTPPSQEPAWSTRLALTLPMLGGVAAELRLGRDGLALALRAEDAGTAQAMRDDLGTLADALRAAGLRVERLTVAHDERAG